MGARGEGWQSASRTAATVASPPEQSTKVKPASHVHLLSFEHVPRPLHRLGQPWACAWPTASARSTAHDSTRAVPRAMGALRISWPGLRIAVGEELRGTAGTPNHLPTDSAANPGFHYTGSTGVTRVHTRYTKQENGRT
jgi:hypothetical protein